MKKRILITALACGLMFSFSGCGKVKVEGFELSHYDGSDFSNGYDSDLLYKNTSEFLGGARKKIPNTAGIFINICRNALP